jgi:hypothetical protein
MEQSPSWEANQWTLQLVTCGYGEGLSGSINARNLGIFYMPQICDMWPMALLPLQRKARWGFFQPEKSWQLRPGLNPRTWVLKGSMLPLDHRSHYSWVLMLQENLSDASSRVSQSHTNGLHSSMMLCGEVWTPEPLKTESTGLSWNVGNPPPTYAAYNPRRAKTSMSLWQMYNTRL